jgi:hypothetical protein
METTLTDAEVGALADMVLERLHAALKEDDPQPVNEREDKEE